MTLKQRWMALWKRLSARGDAGACYDGFVARYSEPHRAYHTLEHVAHCLDELDAIRSFVSDFDAMELALWYHDAIYDPRAKDNEERSAALAVNMVRNASLPDELGQSVTKFIMATKHSVVSADGDALFLVDIDLSILGQAKDRFDEYERQIRKEYEWMSEDAFIAGRSAILKSFLDRSNIYATQFFRDKYEMQARKNIARSLARLHT